MIGAWEFSNADHDKICRFNFRADTVPGGYRLDIDKNCANLFPSTKDITAWAVDNYGALRLLDARGNAVIELSEVESGMYDGFQPGGGPLRDAEPRPRRRSVPPTTWSASGPLRAAPASRSALLTLANTAGRRR